MHAVDLRQGETHLDDAHAQRFGQPYMTARQDVENTLAQAIVVEYVLEPVVPGERRPQVDAEIDAQRLRTTLLSVMGADARSDDQVLQKDRADVARFILSPHERMD